MPPPCRSRVGVGWCKARTRGSRWTQPLVGQVVDDPQFFLDAAVQLERVQTCLLALQSCQRLRLTPPRRPAPARAGSAPPRLGGSTFISSTQRLRRHLRVSRFSRAHWHRRPHQIGLQRCGSHSVKCLDWSHSPTQTNPGSTTKLIYLGSR